MLFIFLANTGYGQRKNIIDSTYRKKFIGFNINPLLSQVMPFNNINQGVTDPSIIFRSYREKFGTRLAIGINTDVNTLDVIAFSGLMGIGSRKKLYNNFYWLSGFEFRVRAINRQLNLPASTTLGNEFVGIANYWGIEYQINNAISISTETAFEFGINPGPFAEAVVSLRPPISLQCHFFIPRK
jgi:hypothetical protein